MVAECAYQSEYMLTKVEVEDKWVNGLITNGAQIQTANFNCNICSNFTHRISRSRSTHSQERPCHYPSLWRQFERGAVSLQQSPFGHTDSVGVSQAPDVANQNRRHDNNCRHHCSCMSPSCFIVIYWSVERLQTKLSELQHWFPSIKVYVSALQEV